MASSLEHFLLFFSLFLVGGVFSGMLAGLLGTGGGLIIVPLLAWTLPYVGVQHQSLMHVAVGTSLSIVVGTSVSSILAHHRRGAISWPLVKSLLPGLIIGAVLGSSLADYLPSKTLKIFFGVFTFLLMLHMWLGSHESSVDRPLPGNKQLGFAGGVIGLIASALGLGGGILVVPYLSRSSLPMRNAVATSSVCGFPVALTGALMMMIFGLNESGIPPGSTGYIYWPAALGFCITSIFFAPLGARIAHRLPTQVLRKIFAVFLLIVSINMVL